MNILTSYTLRCLKQNRVRTLVTIIGIVLSVALFTAVAEGAWSGRQYMIDVTTAEVGSFHGWYEELSDGELADLRAQPQLTRAETLDSVGWALAGDAKKIFPYLRIASMSPGFPELVSVRLLEGRMPNNDRELLISDRASITTGAQLRVGQTLSLSVGQRIDAAGLPLGEHIPYLFEGERLAGAETRSYTIVGVYDRFAYSVESSELPGTLVLTVGEAGTEHKAFFTLERITDAIDFVDAHSYGAKGEVNKDLLLYSGASRNQNLVEVLFGLVAILFALIFFGSVSLIYNAFSISVSERTRQFGLLKSVGATDRQIRRSVLTEALLLCAVALPLGLLLGCGGIGLALRFLRPAFNRIINIEGAENIPIRLALSVPALLSASGMGLLSVLVSAWIPARRAVGLSPIAAIRQSRDVKIRPKSVRVSRLTAKLFGFPGTLAAKNFKRSRKQYRATVLSLFLSVVLFISAYSFGDYLRLDVAGSANRYASDLIVTFINTENNSPLYQPKSERDRLLAALSRTEGVTEAACGGILGGMVELCIPVSALSETASRWIPRDGAQALGYPSVYFVSEALYEALCGEAGMDPKDGQAVAYLKMHTEESHGLNTVYSTFDILRPDSLPLELEASWDVNIPGYRLLDSETDPKTGKVISYVFYPEDGELEADGSLKEAELLRLGPEVVRPKRKLTIGGAIEKLPLAAEREDFSLYFPISRAEELLGSEERLIFAYYFNAERHGPAAKAMEETLKELNLNNCASVFDTREGQEAGLALLLVLNVFTFGFIILISLIAAANVFNTISTNVALRRREFATLKSVGMGNRAFGRMMRFECLLYGAKALLWGLPVSVGISWLIWRVVDQGFRTGSFRSPWTAMAIAAGSVFLVVFATMLYATGKIRKDNPIDALKRETL